MRCSLAILVALAGVAAAEPDHRQRVVLADSDPELRRAVEAALRPWRIEVVVETTVPSDAASAQARADDRAARFVVWREGDHLVVYDRDSGQEEKREARAGSFDPPGAAAAALTVKTMMRLPAPPPEVTVTAPPPSPVIAPRPSGIELRLWGGAGSRFEQGLDSNIALRFTLAAEVRPWPDRGFRFGLYGDFGASALVEQAGFHGTWTNWAVLATASWALARGPWELGAWAGAGVEASVLDGLQMGASRTERADLVTLRGGPTARYKLGRWTVGLVTAIETLPSTRTYTRPGSSSADVFEIPPLGVIGELAVGTDLSP